MHILLIEDDKTQARTFQNRLQQAGWQVTIAPDGASAKEALEEGTPDAVLLDLELPDTSGLDLLERLRSTHPGLPVLILTATGTPEAAYRALSHGAVDYLVKGPEIVKDLPDRVAKAVDEWRGIDHLGRKAEPTSNRPDDDLPAGARDALEELAERYVESGTADGMVTCSPAGVLITSNLPETANGQLLASRMAAQAHQARRTGEAAGLEGANHLLFVRNGEGLLVVAGGAPGIMVGLLFPRGTSPVAAMRRVQEATRLLLEAIEDGR